MYGRRGCRLATMSVPRFAALIFVLFADVRTWRRYRNRPASVSFYPGTFFRRATSTPRARIASIVPRLTPQRSFFGGCDEKNQDVGRG